MRGLFRALALCVAVCAGSTAARFGDSCDPSGVFRGVDAVCSDVDDTILPSDMWQVPQEARDAFALLGKLVSRRALVSGSSLSRALDKWACPTPRCLAPWVDVIAVETGLVVYSTADGSEVYRWGEAESEREAFAQWSEVKPLLAQRVESMLADEFAAGQAWWRNNEIVLTVNTSGCAEPAATARRVYDKLQNDTLVAGSDGKVVTFVFPDAVDIIPSAANKANATKMLAEMWGIKLSNILALGDSANDVFEDQVLQGCRVATYDGSKVSPLAKELSEAFPGQAAVLPGRYVPPHFVGAVAEQIALCIDSARRP